MFIFVSVIIFENHFILKYRIYYSKFEVEFHQMEQPTASIGR